MSIPFSTGAEKRLRSRFLRFILVGGLNTAFGFLVYAVLILMDAPTWVALLLATAAGVVFNFFTIGGMVFRTVDRTQAFRFALSYLFILAINLKCIEWTFSILGDRILAQAALALPIAGLSYLLMSRFVFVSGTR